MKTEKTDLNYSSKEWLNIFTQRWIETIEKLNQENKLKLILHFAIERVEETESKLKLLSIANQILEDQLLNDL